MTVLTVGMVLVCAIPSYLSVSALGPLGRPGVLWFLAAVLWWEWSQLQRPFPLVTQTQPVRRFLFLFLAVVVASYALTNFAGLPPDEGRAADTGAIRMLSWAGIFLIANDGITDRERLLVLLRRVATVGALMSALGLLQFATGQSLVSALTVPGFTAGADFDNIQGRSGFLRAAGTASHPLEYGIVLCMSLPIAVSLALNDAKGRYILRWLAVGVILCASALSVSRSALIGIGVALAVLVPGLPRFMRLRIFFILSVGAAALYLFVPGMVGTVRGLFTGISEDGSTQSRTSSYEAAVDLVGRNPWVGRGFGTFLPEYRIVDNQYLLLLIELGLAGFFFFIVMLVRAVCSCLQARRAFKDPFMQQMSIALISSLAAGSVMFAFFDALSFPMAASFMFLILGLAGAVWRVARNETNTPVLPAPVSRTSSST